MNNTTEFEYVQLAPQTNKSITTESLLQMNRNFIGKYCVMWWEIIDNYIHELDNNNYCCKSKCSLTELTVVN